MPLVEITLRKGHSPEFLRSAGEAVHEALVAEGNVPPDDRFQIFHLVDSGQVIAHPTYGGVSRSDDLVVIKITLNAGRTTEVKKKLYAEIARRLERAVDVRPDDVLVCLVEVSKENWSFGKGVATYG
ncbi:MAG TPA: tautomerase family protein [Thermoanaerobaculia bacterium]|nr:tautomerase family protein [Thermoanaerobaculia bacterium]